MNGLNLYFSCHDSLAFICRKRTLLIGMNGCFLICLNNLFHVYIILSKNEIVFFSCLRLLCMTITCLLLPLPNLSMVRSYNLDTDYQNRKPIKKPNIRMRQNWIGAVTNRSENAMHHHRNACLSRILDTCQSMQNDIQTEHTNEQTNKQCISNHRSNQFTWLQCNIT